MASLSRVQAWIVGALFLAAYVGLERLTYSKGFSVYGDAPWNPAVGLGYALLLTKGLRFVPIFIFAEFLADIVARSQPFNLPTSVLEAALIVAPYALGAYVLKQPRIGFDPGLHRIRDVVKLLLAGTGCALAASVVHVAGLAMGGQVPGHEIVALVLRHAIGVVIGFAVVTPFVLMLFSRSLGRIDLSWLLEAAVLLAVVMLMTGLHAAAPERNFFLLLIPIIWIAMKQGLSGAARSLVVTLLALMVALYLGRIEPPQAGAYQAIMLTLSIVGVMIGAMGDEQSAAGGRLRLLQESLEQAMRLASADRLAMSIAHEVNQPLTAAGNYCRASLLALDRQGAPAPLASSALRSAIAQIDRGAQVLNSIREFVQSGRLSKAEFRLPQVVDEVLNLLGPRLAQADIELSTHLQRNTPKCYGDRHAIQVVLLNIIRNAVEALEASRENDRKIGIVVQVSTPGAFEVSVSDNGCGFEAGVDTETELPVRSAKTGGFGIGLSLSRSIIVAHGGTMHIRSGAQGATIIFSLPVYEGGAHV